MGYVEDEWSTIWPVLNFPMEVALKVHPAGYGIRRPIEDSCMFMVDEFYFLLWANENLSLNVDETYFVDSENKSVLIDEIRKAETDVVFYSRSSEKTQSAVGDNLVRLNRSRMDVRNLGSILSRDFRRHKMTDDYVENYWKITPDKPIGCPDESYKLNIAFKNNETGNVGRYTVYFYPAEYDSMTGHY